jgi:hypothetical protein
MKQNKLKLCNEQEDVKFMHNESFEKNVLELLTTAHLTPISEPRSLIWSAI